MENFLTKIFFTIIIPYVSPSSQTQAAPLEIHLKAKTWNELSKVQAVTAFSLLTEGTKLSLHLPMLSLIQRLRAFYYLAQLPEEVVAEWELSDTLSTDDALDGETAFAYSLHQACHEVLAPLITTDPEQLSGSHTLRFERTRPFWPELKRKGKTAKDSESWYAPAPGWDNLTIYEMASAFSLLEQYGETTDITHLHRLLATLYRPAKPATAHNIDTNYQGDRRIPYREHGEHTVERRMKEFSKLNPGELNLLLFWAMSCRHSIIERYPRVFNGKQRNADRHPNDYGWGGVLLSIANGVADLDRVADQNCHTVLTYLSKLEDERLEFEMWGK
jgi:hypothetical protein